MRTFVRAVEIPVCYFALCSLGTLHTQTSFPAIAGIFLAVFGRVSIPIANIARKGVILRLRPLWILLVRGASFSIIPIAITQTTSGTN